MQFFHEVLLEYLEDFIWFSIGEMRGSSKDNLIIASFLFANSSINHPSFLNQSSSSNGSSSFLVTCFQSFHMAFGYVLTLPSVGASFQFVNSS